jgi:hypothetical protein
MYYEPESRVIVRYGVVYKGQDLSDEIGLVQDASSYILVYFPRLDIEVKMLAYEIDHYPRIDEEDIDWS